MGVEREPMKVLGTAIDCDDANALADFYAQMLGWVKTFSGNGIAVVSTPDYPALLVFQSIEHYQKPVWPWSGENQGQMMHFDFLVENLAEAVEHAIKCGATVSEVQYFESSTTLFDPAGHPFCLSTVREEGLYAK
jgi:catechol-2,3-dioxygenase